MRPTLFLYGILAAATSASAAFINYQSGTLTRTNRDCDGNIDSGGLKTESFGSVSVVRAANLLVSVPVLLKGTPNTEYVVRVIQIKNGAAVSCPQCPNGDGTLKTNNMGIGNTNIQKTVSAGATSAFVVLNKKTDCGDFFTIPPVPIT